MPTPRRSHRLAARTPTPCASPHVSEDYRAYRRRLVSNGEGGGADRHRLGDPSPVTVVYVRKRLSSRDFRARLRMEHDADGRIDTVAPVRPSGAQDARCQANRTRL